ncbi:MAG: radical SAM protein [Deltaproteobacteria bacterium]|nr:radical SAM protein [Deltaproteobacteria bacterium]
MRILLVNPPYPVCESLTMPLGLLYLAARLEKAGHEVFLEDAQLCRSPLRRLKRTLLRLDPQVVGITSFSINLAMASRMLQMVKRLCPGAVTVWGGPHVSFADEDILRHHTWVDVIVRGEGEETLVELMEKVRESRRFDNILGISWRETDGSIHRNPSRPFREDLDQLPRPAWHLLKLSQYRAFGDGASVLTSRGCPHRCVFCVGRKMIGAKGRFRSPASVVDEMEALVNQGFRRIRVEDDLFTFRRERTLAICQELDDSGLAVKWRAYARVDSVDPELLSRMRQAGCERILFGAESGSPEILQHIRKGITPEQTRRAVEMARDAGIGVLASFVLGLPGETPQTLRQTLKFADSLRVPYSLNLLTPYVGTEIREQAAEWGIQILSSDWSLYGQGHPITATPTVKPWHLSRAVNNYRRGISQYLQDILEAEGRGRLGKEHRDELQRYRHWNFLRRLIGEEILERHGNTLRESNGLKGPVKSIAPRLGMKIREVEKHLQPLIQEGNICLQPIAQDRVQWEWAEN